MLPRTEFEMSEAIRDFTVVLSGEKLLGCGALHFYSPTLAEIRSLAVSEQAKTLGVGRKLVGALVAEAQEYELDAAFAFTYVTAFFQKVGFHVVERGALPLKAWKDCLRCPKFQACDEIAVLRVLRPDHWAERCLKSGQVTTPDDHLIQIPTPAAWLELTTPPEDQGTAPSRSGSEIPAKLGFPPPRKRPLKLSTDARNSGYNQSFKD
jgi:amino-acid N-acetyltransferase